MRRTPLDNAFFALFCLSAALPISCCRTGKEQVIVPETAAETACPEPVVIMTNEEILACEGIDAGLSVNLAVALGQAESTLQADAVNDTSRGLCQINTFGGNAEWLAVKYIGTAENLDLFDARTSARLGCRYLADLIVRFGDLDLALAAYNWGPKKVAAVHGDKTKLPVKVRAYISSVHKYMDKQV
jgi:soluble lytic murein transglycosylase-like protein